ncbi:hypothetical protein EVAR_19767_1 [Eumeta japonica]|uniref:Uncharacterized protein n=1 Tax=Eumeta variegata TaxID=151549 RepID=A0A4C1UQL2_EUMVA|nr:hypothetical protein EVAR_19767_1 [Eumeta japonica]
MASAQTRIGDLFHCDKLSPIAFPVSALEMYIDDNIHELLTLVTRTQARQGSSQGPVKAVGVAVRNRSPDPKVQVQ